MKDWEVIRKIGSGRSSNVYEVKNKITGKIYAMKELSKYYKRIIQDIDYQNIAYKNNLAPKIITYYNDGKNQIIIMEKMMYTLKEYIEIKGKLTNKEKNNLIKLLKELDKINIMHNDIIKQNVITNGDGIFKLIDFGSAKKGSVGLNGYPNINGKDRLIDKSDLNILIDFLKN